MASSTNFSSSSRSVQQVYPSGGVEQAKATNRASFSLSKLEGWPASTVAYGATPPRIPFRQLLAKPINHCRIRIQRRNDFPVAPTLAEIHDIWLQ